jgi:hypothetical protein
MIVRGRGFACDLDTAPDDHTIHAVRKLLNGDRDIGSYVIRPADSALSKNLEQRPQQIRHVEI